MSNDAAVERFRVLLRIPTVSLADVGSTNWAAFEAFRDAVAEAYPTVHASVERELVAGHTMLWRWPGVDPALPPVILMAHQDVVAPGRLEDWRHPAFDAELVDHDGDRIIWGRGTIDDKGSLVAILEAADHLAADGFRPTRDVWFVFGHDEETNGTGAAAAAALLAERGVRPELVLDEGGAIVGGFLPGVDARLAAIGITEKGVANFRLSVTTQGGHSSAPPANSAILRLSTAIARIDRGPFPARLTAATRGMFRAAGRGGRGLLPWLYRGVAWSGPLLVRALQSKPEGAAMTRTTVVATQISGGHALNAVPERAEAVMNARVLAGETLAGTLERLRAATGDRGVDVELISGWEPAPISPTDGPGWERLVATIADIFPDVVPAPYGQTGATDSRSFTSLTEAVYRFTPFDLSEAERAALHAVDERIRVDSWLAGIAFYRAFLAKL
ncbi:MAG TPA: M20/M25/M40 family metallo-hydrolase [Microbacteriaceae bacterium]|nr:M20/M25/M40 family metallo-hydrolase [Microbacteriaceae bacterium]